MNDTIQQTATGRLLTLPESMERLRVSKATLHRLIRDREIPSVRSLPAASSSSPTSSGSSRTTASPSVQEHIMAKRANGEGTITLRKDGRWEAASYVPTLDGRMKRVRFYARSRKEAHEKLVAKHDEVRRGFLTPNSQVTVAEYLQQWLETVVPRRNRRNTARGYEGVVRLHIVPRIGNKRLTQLTVRDVQNAAYALLDDGHSIRTAQKFRTVLSAALTRAMRDEP